MVTVWFATVMVPARAAPLFAATCTTTDPLPDADGVPTVIHGTWLVAVHVQPSMVVTSIDVGPPAADMARVVADSPY